VATYRLSGTNDRYNDGTAYSFGNELQVSAGISDRFLISGWLVDPMLILRYRSVLPDQIDQKDFPSTGGQWIYLAPGVNINFTPKLSARIVGDIPLYRNLTGAQLTTSYKLNIGLLYKIPLQQELVDIDPKKQF
ncbi:MAG: hypothetical protein IH946_12025, partial [Bacteroidetes bacterium]|nr:hypothetical protein [Bacteroidota bacterium]